jgi:polyhydroxyalkanoate synthesis regulator phasin
VTDKPPLRSLAGHVLSTGEATPDEARRLAASVLGEEPDVPPTRSERELRELLSKISDKEGQHERVQEVRRQLASIGVGT